MSAGLVKVGRKGGWPESSALVRPRAFRIAAMISLNRAEPHLIKWRGYLLYLQLVCSFIVFTSVVSCQVNLLR